MNSKSEMVRWCVPEPEEEIRPKPLKDRNFAHCSPLEDWIDQAELRNFEKGVKAAFHACGIVEEDQDIVMRTMFILLRQELGG